jgi:hypothetical protein
LYFGRPSLPIGHKSTAIKLKQAEQREAALQLVWPKNC